MLKTDNHSLITYLQSTLMHSSSDYFIKIHKMYKPTPVARYWEIENNRMNNDLHLMYIISGKGTYALGDEVIPMKKGQLFLVSNNYPHSAYSDPKDLLHIYSMRFGVYSTKTNMFIPNFFKNPFGTFFTLNASNQCLTYLDKAYQHYLEQGPISAFALDALMRHLLLELCTTSEHENRSIQISHITNGIHDNHGVGMSVASMAKEMGLSIKQFTRVFSNINHTTPHQLIIHARINHAKYLLEETTMSIKAIAYELGYPDAFTFSRQFKKKTGLTPSQHRTPQTPTDHLTI